MTANLVVQVCIEPKLVAVALERESVTAAPRAQPAAPSPSPSSAARDRDVVRRFVKPVVDVERSPDGAVLAMSGHPVTEVGPGRLPVLASAAGLLRLHPARAEELGSHTLCIGEVTDVGGEPPMSCAWRTPGCTTAADTAGRFSSALALGRVLRAQVDAQRQDPVDQLGLGVADHGEVREVLLGLLAEALAFGALDRRHAARADGLGPLAEPGHHLLGVEGGHARSA